MKIKSDVLLRDVAGEKALFLQGRRVGETTKVVALNATSLLLWNELHEREFEVEDVAKVLVDHYVVGQATAMEDARRWVVTLTENGLIE